MRSWKDQTYERDHQRQSFRFIDHEFFDSHQRGSRGIGIQYGKADDPKTAHSENVLGLDEPCAFNATVPQVSQHFILRGAQMKEVSIPGGVPLTSTEIHTSLSRSDPSVSVSVIVMGPQLVEGKRERWGGAVIKMGHEGPTKKSFVML